MHSDTKLNLLRSPLFFHGSPLPPFDPPSPRFTPSLVARSLILSSHLSYRPLIFSFLIRLCHTACIASFQTLHLFLFFSLSLSKAPWLGWFLIFSQLRYVPFSFLASTWLDFLRFNSVTLFPVLTPVGCCLTLRSFPFYQLDFSFPLEPCRSRFLLFHCSFRKHGFELAACIRVCFSRIWYIVSSYEAFNFFVKSWLLSTSFFDSFL